MEDEPRELSSSASYGRFRGKPRVALDASRREGQTAPLLLSQRDGRFGTFAVERQGMGFASGVGEQLRCVRLHDEIGVALTDAIAHPRARIGAWPAHQPINPTANRG